MLLSTIVMTGITKIPLLVVDYKSREEVLAFCQVITHKKVTILWRNRLLKIKNHIPSKDASMYFMKLNYNYKDDVHLVAVHDVQQMTTILRHKLRNDVLTRTFSDIDRKDKREPYSKMQSRMSL